MKNFSVNISFFIVRNFSGKKISRFSNFLAKSQNFIPRISKIFWPTAKFTSAKFWLWKPRNFNPMLNFCNINDNMACFQSRIWRECWNSWIKGLAFIGDYRKAMTRKYRRENEKKLQERGQKSEGKEVE